MKIGTVEVELKPKDIEGIKNKIKEDLINEGFVEVVRCKNCKRYQPWYDDGDCICMRLGSYRGDTKPTDYCSYGERKDGEEE